MRRIRVLLVMLSMAAIGVPVLHAQGPAGSGTVQMPRPGSGSMIGVRLSDVTADQVKSLKLPRAEGAMVAAVNPNSPAATAGLRANDVIVEFDGERVRSAQHLSRLVSETPAGRDIALTVMRDGKKTDLHIKPETGNWFNPQFGQMPRDIPDMLPGARAGATSRGRLGASVQEMSPDLAEYFGVKSGVLIANVQNDSAAAKAGLKAGDVVTEVDGHRVDTPSDLVKALPTGDGSRDVNLTVMRDKKELKLKATIPAG